MLFRWDALEGVEAEEGLGITRGDGPWGVSTLKVNPITGEPTITRFTTEADAIDYARTRATQTGSPVRSPAGRVFYILHWSVDSPVEGSLRYRVLRGQRGARQRAGADHNIGERQEQILVFRHGGEVPGHEDSIRWVLAKDLTLDVEDPAAVQEATRLSKGKQRLTRWDREGDR